MFLLLSSGTSTLCTSSWCDHLTNVPQDSILSSEHLVIQHLQCAYHSHTDDIQVYTQSSVEDMSYPSSHRESRYIIICKSNQMSSDHRGKQTNPKQVRYGAHPTSCLQQLDYTSEYSSKEPGVLYGLNT